MTSAYFYSSPFCWTAFSDRNINRGKVFFGSNNLCIQFKWSKRLFGLGNRGPATTCLLMRPGDKSSFRKIRYREKYYYCLKILQYLTFCLLSKYGNYGTYALRQFPLTLCPFWSFLYLHKSETKYKKCSKINYTKILVDNCPASSRSLI